MEYILGLLGVYVAHVAERITAYRGRVFLLMSMIPIGVLAVLRGDVGTDTAAYEEIVRSYRDDGASVDLEPGFRVLASLLIALTPSDGFVVRLFSLLIILLLMGFVVRSDREERLTLALYWIPAFVYHYTMNGLRIGFASAFLLLAAQSYHRKQFLSAVVLSLVAVSFHYSIALSIFSVLLVVNRWRAISSIAGAVAAIFAVLAFSLLNEEYFQRKVLLYSDFASPGPLSGLAKVAAIAVLLLGAFLMDIRWREKQKLLLVVGTFTVVFWSVGTFSYAGLRLLDILAFATPILILAKLKQVGAHYGVASYASLAIAGLLSAMAMYLGFVGTEGVGDTPFLPYEFMFQYL